ncbi:MAG: hypothetical protein U0931_30480 [Vulcanimicrobiota bacterium]
MDLITAQGEELCAGGDYQAAQSQLPKEHFLQGEILYWLGHPEARERLRGLDGARARLAEARCCWQADLYDQGLELLAGLQGEAEAELTRALLWLCQGRREAAEAILPAALSGLNGHRLLRAYFDLGVSYEFLELLEPARDFFQKAASGWRQLSATHPELAASLFGLAGVQQKLRDPDIRSTCLEFMQRFPAQDQRWPAMAEALALDFLEERRWVELEPILQQIWQRSERASVAYLLGVAHSQLDRPTQAREWMLRAESGFLSEGRPDMLERARANLQKLTS